MHSVTQQTDFTGYIESYIGKLKCVKIIVDTN